MWSSLYPYSSNYKNTYICNLQSSLKALQSDPLNSLTGGPVKSRTNKRIEPLSDSDLLWQRYKMGPAKFGTINRIEPLSSDPLSGLDCMLNAIKG